MTDTSTPSGGARRPRRGQPPPRGDGRRAMTIGSASPSPRSPSSPGSLILESIAERGAGAGRRRALSARRPSPRRRRPSARPGPPRHRRRARRRSTTTTARLVASGDAIVVVANASGIGGTATGDDRGARRRRLARRRGSANSNGQQLDAASIIYFVEGEPAALGVARLLAEQIPNCQHGADARHRRRSTGRSTRLADRRPAARRGRGGAASRRARLSIVDADAAGTSRSRARRSERRSSYGAGGPARGRRPDRAGARRSRPDSAPPSVTRRHEIPEVAGPSAPALGALARWAQPARTGTAWLTPARHRTGTSEVGRNVSSIRSASSWSWIVFEPVAGLPDSTRATWRRS